MSAPVCPSCGKPMQLFFQEEHPTDKDRILIAFECSSCVVPILTKTVQPNVEVKLTDSPTRYSSTTTLARPAFKNAMAQASQNAEMAAYEKNPEQREFYLRAQKKWLAIAEGWRQIVDVNKIERSK